MTLQEKITPYLPYGLRVSCGDSKSMEREMTHDYWDGSKVCLSAVLSNKYKPILHPLSEIEDELKNELKEKARKLGYGDWWFNDQVLHLENGHHGLVPYWMILDLIKKKVDVFQMIPSGEAIDINTLN